MATVKKGMLTTTGEWWKHLRETKRVFWKGERRAAQEFIRHEAESAGNTRPAETQKVSPIPNPGSHRQ